MSNTATSPASPVTSTLAPTYARGVEQRYGGAERHPSRDRSREGSGEEELLGPNVGGQGGGYGNGYGYAGSAYAGSGRNSMSTRPSDDVEMGRRF